MRDLSRRGTQFISVTLACALVVGLSGPACLQAQSSAPSPAATPAAASKTPLPPQPRKTRERVPTIDTGARISRAFGLPLSRLIAEAERRLHL